MKSKFFAVAVLVAMVFVATSSAFATTISITGTDGIQPFGEPDTATYGQTFKLNAGDDNYLDSFRFSLNDSYDSGDV